MTPLFGWKKNQSDYGLRYCLALLSLCSVSLGGETVRTCPFRYVLHTVAQKVGLDPTQGNFISDEAIPVGIWIDSWARRTYDAQDWPEWTVTKAFAPAGHVVPWDYLSGFSSHNPVTTKLGRIFAVYLVDPSTTNAPVETDYTLTPSGIHVGYEHGTNVWIKYIAPAPRFTAEVWNSTNIYKINEVAYSYTTGEVYRSKSNGNLGHDPATTFSLPMDPVVEAPAIPPPTTEMTQDWVPDNPGVIAQDQIVDVLYESDAGIPDPPPANTRFNLGVLDVDGNELANEVVISTGAESIATLLATLVTQLIADMDLSTFTITSTGTTVRLQDASNFSIFVAFWGLIFEPNQNVPVHQIQVYNAGFSAASGQPKITRITITDATTYLGYIYSLKMIGADGVEHIVYYTSTLFDSSAQILQGLIDAKLASSDTFWTTVQLIFDPTNLTLDVAIKDNASTDVRVDLPVPPAGGAWWELVPFPLALADQVIRGATGDVLKEWGQFPEGQAEEQAVGQEAGVRAGAFSVSDAPLTQQVKPSSRYRIP